MKIIELRDRVLFLDDIIQIYEEGHYYYVTTKNGTYNIYESDYIKIKNYLLSLNDEVEIIEETPQVQVEMTEKQYFKYLDEKYKYMEQVKNYKPKPSYLKIEEENKIPEKLNMTYMKKIDDDAFITEKFSQAEQKIVDTVNQIIDYLKSKGE